MKIHLFPSGLLVTAFCSSASILPAQETPAAPPPKAIPVEDSAVPAAAVTEAPAVLNASQFLGADLVSGPFHRVRELVPTDGYLAHYMVDSDFGSFEVEGTTQLKTCILEINAIGKLNAVSKSDLFADGLKRSLEQPIDAAKNVVRHPVETVKALPSTVGHFFKKVGSSVSSAASGIRDRADARNEDGGSQTGGGAKDVGRALGSAGKGIIGFDTAKLECAKQLRVDPYSDNPRLQEEMEKVTWVFFSGGLPLRVGAMATGASLAIGATKFAGLPDEIYTLTPGEIQLRNTQAMAALLVQPEVQDQFNNNPALTLSLRRSILISIADIDGARNRAGVVALAAGCADRQQARFLDESLRMMAMRQADGAPKIVEFKLLGRIPAAVNSAGALELSLPVDYVSWTPEVAEFAGRDDFAGLQPTIVHTGGFSATARRELTRLGWTLRRM